MTDLLIDFLAFGWATLLVLFLLIVVPYMAHHEWNTRKNLDDLDDLSLYKDKVELIRNDVVDLLNSCDGNDFIIIREQIMDKLRKEVNL